jgi:hypothetical protein
MAQEIMVLCINRQFLDYIHPALARKFLKDKSTSVFSRDPFIIQFNRSRCEYWAFKALTVSPGAI